MQSMGTSLCRQVRNIESSFVILQARPQSNFQKKKKKKLRLPLMAKRCAGDEIDDIND